MTTPKAFISYSWSSPEHEAWVIRLAENLRESGVDVLFDKWDLNIGDDAHAFMEKIVTDPSVTKVIIVCDQKYTEKADGRNGGVGAETQIITPAIYGQQIQSKFAAVICEKGKNGEWLVPTYFRSRLHIDMSDSVSYGEGFEKLLRWIFEKPLHVKPPLGRPPSFLQNGDAPRILTTILFRRAQESLRNGQPYASVAVTEHFEAIADGLEAFRLHGKNFTQDTYDDAVVKSIDDFILYRNECVEMFRLVANYLPEDKSSEIIHIFLEKILPFTVRPNHITEYQEWDFDNYRFIVHELFLYAIAAVIKAGKFSSAATILNTPIYNHARAINGQGATQNYSATLGEIKSLEYRNVRLKLGRYSLQADLLKKRTTNLPINFQEIVQADFVIYLHARLADNFWFPITGVYESFIRAPFEIFARARSLAYYRRISPLFGKRSIEKLQADIRSIETDRRRLPNWRFYSLVPSKCMA